MFKFLKASKQYQRGQISVSDRAIGARFAYIGLTEEDLGVVHGWADVCRNSLDLVVDKFYEHILGNRETSEILNRHSSVERQRPMLTRYILTMFAGRIDGGAEPVPGQDVERAGGGEPAGTVVLAAPADGGWLVLFEAQSGALDAGPLAIGGRAVALTALPYAIP